MILQITSVRKISKSNDSLGGRDVDVVVDCSNGNILVLNMVMKDTVEHIKNGLYSPFIDTNSYDSYWNYIYTTKKAAQRSIQNINSTEGCLDSCYLIFRAKNKIEYFEWILSNDKNIDHT